MQACYCDRISNSQNHWLMNLLGIVTQRFPLKLMEGLLKVCNNQLGALMWMSSDCQLMGFGNLFGKGSWNPFRKILKIFFFFLILTCSLTENKRTCLNLGSYNYLGFAASDEYCTPRVIESLQKFSQSTCSSRADGGKSCNVGINILDLSKKIMKNLAFFFLIGNTVLHEELEHMVAAFVGKPAAMVYGMGFATNSTSLPTLIGKVVSCTIPIFHFLLSMFIEGKSLN